MTDLPLANEDAFADAEAALAALASEYPAYAQADVDEMMRLADELARRFDAGTCMAETVSALHAVAHNVKGQGASFGYELMTVFGEAMCIETRDRSRLDAINVSRTRALVAACRRVLAEGLLGWGGEPGARLMAELGISAEAV